MFVSEFFDVREKYYPLLKEWWESKKGFSAIHPDLLSKNGLMVSYKNIPICAAWLYCTDSAYGVINWIITNNSSGGKIKKQAIVLLLTELEKKAKDLGIRLIYVPMETKSIKKVLLQKNFVKGSEITEFFK